MSTTLKLRQSCAALDLTQLYCAAPFPASSTRLAIPQRLAPLQQRASFGVCLFFICITPQLQRQACPMCATPDETLPTKNQFALAAKQHDGVRYY
mmetsp:Transcript_5851/g.12173  ORF Transcript_5851/g.12173 Transcript_5851/m.12173 type:complete len:95 (+) Transcript_5851:650-934(+)